MIFKDSKPEMAFLKMGIYGKAGSGKTFTSSKVAIGLRSFAKDDRPIAFLDTETGSDFVKPVLFDKAGVKLQTAKTRSFSDLVEAVREAEKNNSVLIIDSITHFWNEVIASYLKVNELKRMSLHHWGPLKQTWREFTDAFLNSRLHIVMCGRSGDVWDDVVDEEGAKETKVVGTKMKAEVETAYEPSLLVEMIPEFAAAGKRAKMVHVGYVRKDRFDQINGRAFPEPTFDDFLPHIGMLTIGGEHVAIDETRTSEDKFVKGDYGAKREEQKKTLLEKIQNEVYLLHPSSSNEDKKARLELLRKIFGTHSWNEIAGVRNIALLDEGLKKLEGLNQPAESDTNKKED